MKLTKCLFATLTLGVLCTFPSLHAQAEEWSKTYTLTGKPDLHVETSDANIRVSTWDQNTIQAKVISTRYKIGEGGIHVEEHQNGNSVEIDVRYPHRGLVIDVGSHRVDVEIQMPREGTVDLHTGDGQIALANFKGEMQTAQRRRLPGNR